MALYTKKNRVRLASRLLVLSALILLPLINSWLEIECRIHPNPNFIHHFEDPAPWIFPQILILLLVATAWLTAIKNWHPPGSCRSCGYDLRGSWPVGSEACPECGNTIHADVGKSIRLIPMWLRVANVLLIVIPFITVLTLSIMAYLPIPYKPLIHPMAMLFNIPDWQTQYRSVLENQMMMRYLLINITLSAISLAIIFQHASRRPGVWVLLAPIVSVGLFCGFAFILLPALR